MTSIDSAPTVLDFWAPWCGPCRMMAPTIDKLKSEYEGRVSIKKINADENAEMTEKYGVQALPTMVFISANGTEVKRIVGATSESTIRAEVDKLL